MQEILTQKRRPPHPGLVVAELLDDLDITLTDFAKHIGVSRRTISLIVNAHRPVTVDLALRFAAFFGKAPDLWLNLQRKVDIWVALHSNKKVYQKIKPFPHQAA